MVSGAKQGLEDGASGRGGTGAGTVVDLRIALSGVLRNGDLRTTGECTLVAGDIPRASGEHHRRCIVQLGRGADGRKGIDVRCAFPAIRYGGLGASIGRATAQLHCGRSTHHRRWLGIVIARRVGTAPSGQSPIVCFSFLKSLLVLLIYRPHSRLLDAFVSGACGQVRELWWGCRSVALSWVKSTFALWHVSS